MAVFRSMGARKDDVRGTAAVEVRKALARMFSGRGVLPGADSPLVVGSDAFAYVVRSAGWVTSRNWSGDGAHLWGNDGDITLSTADDGSSLVAPAPGLSRIDVMYALHPSANENGDITSEPVVAVRKGVEGAPPIAPSLPAGAEELGRNTMTSAATSTSSAGNTIVQSARRAAVRAGSEVRLEGTSVFSGSGGASLSSALLTRVGDQVSTRIAIANVTAPAGAQSTAIGNLQAAVRPPASVPWQGWSTPGLVTGTILPDGSMAVRWTSAALSSATVIVTASWPV